MNKRKEKSKKKVVVVTSIGQAHIKCSFNNIIISFIVPGNSSRHVGDLIRFELPSLIPPDSEARHGAAEIGHQLYSGFYLISKIRHKITPDKYETDMELIKNSFAKRIPGQETTLSVEGTSWGLNKEDNKKSSGRSVRVLVGVQG